MSNMNIDEMNRAKHQTAKFLFSSKTTWKQFASSRQRDTVGNGVKSLHVETPYFKDEIASSEVGILLIKSLVTLSHYQFAVMVSKIEFTHVNPWVNLVSLKPLQ